MTTIDLVKKELGFYIENLDSIYEMEEFLKQNPLDIYPSPTKGYSEMMEVIFYQTWTQEIKELDNYISDSYNKIKNQIGLFLSKEEINQFAMEKNDFLLKQLEENKWTHIINIEKFHLCTNLFFISKIYGQNLRSYDEKLKAYISKYYPPLNSRPMLAEKFRQIIFEDFFYEFKKLLKTLIDVKLVHILRRKLQATSDKKNSYSTQKIEPNFEENKYPKVFKSAYGYELFRYLVQVDDEKIAPAWGRKYFDLFKEEKLIKLTSKPINFIRFLKSEYGLELPGLDGRASFNEEAVFLKEIEKDFQEKYNARRS